MVSVEIPLEDCYNARVVLSPKHGNSCQKERLPFRFRVSMTERPAASRRRTVKNRVEKLFVWSISPSRRSFFRGKSRIAFRKDETFLPQSSSCWCRKKGKTGLRRAFPILDGVRLRANFICPFVSYFSCVVWVSAA